MLYSYYARVIVSYFMEKFIVNKTFLKILVFLMLFDEFA